MKTEPLILPVEADDTQYDAAMDRVQRKLDSFANKAVSIGNKLSLGLTLPMTLFAKSAVSSYEQFDQAMIQSTSIISGMTAESKKAMEDQAKVIASTTRTSAAKAAEAYYFLASAGMDAQQAIGALPIVEKFATAGAFDMAKATELLADSQSALGLSMGSTAQRMKEMTRVSDVLVDAANMSNASVEQFAKALTTKSAAALRGMNKEVEEGVAVLGVYADAGIKGEMAGEKLAIMLRESQNAALRESEAWDSLGMSLYDTKGNMKPLVEVIRMLENATAGLSDQQKVAKFDMLGFRSESIDAIRPLLGMSQKIEDYEKRLRSAGGATKDVADKQMKSFSSQMAILRNQMELASIEIGEALAPSLLSMNQHIASALNYWRSLSDETKQFTVSVGKVVAIMGPALVMFGKTITLFQTLSPTMGTIATTTMAAVGAVWGFIATFAMANPITAAIIGIGAAIAGVVYWLKGPESFGAAWDWVTTKVSNFTTISLAVLSNWKENASILAAWLGAEWQNILTDMATATLILAMNMANNIAVGIKTTMRLFVAFYGWLWQASTKFFTYIFSDEFAAAVYKGAIAALEGIANFATRAWTVLQQWASMTVTIVTAVAKGIYDTMAAIPSAVFTVLTTTLVKFKDMMMMILSGELPDIKQFMKDVANAAAEQFDIALEKTAIAIDKAATKIEESMASVVEQTKADFNAGMADPNFFNTAKNILKEGLDEMKGPLEGFTANTNAPELIGMDALQKDLDAVGTLAKDDMQLIQEAGDAVNKGMGQAVDGLDDMKDGLGSGFDTKGMKKSVDAVQAYTSEAVDMWLGYQKTANKMDPNQKPIDAAPAAALGAGMAMAGAMGMGGLPFASTMTGMSAFEAAKIEASKGQKIQQAGTESSGGSTKEILAKIEQNTRQQIQIKVIQGT